MRDAVTTGLDGNAEQKVTITPDRYTKLYLDRVEHLRDWCLSRQLWWGHRIPAWYRPSVIPAQAGIQPEIYVGVTPPEGEGWVQDEDTLDTWFSSGSWTFSTLGWPGKTDDLGTYHPTQWIQMGYEILYLWLMRMILMSSYALSQIPFKDAYIHGLLRDKDGKKFSKSSGNNLDPIDVMNEYGCDALRVSLLSGITPGNDSRFYTEKVEAARNLMNKIWNISRFILGSASGARHIEFVFAKTLADRWILGRFSETTEKVGSLIDRYDFSLAIEVLRDFTWTDFADWYLEIAKIEGEKDDVLLYILERLLILWHPFAPFISEEIYTQFGRGMCMVAQWPKSDPRNETQGPSFEEDTKMMEMFKETVIAIRNIRAQYKIEPKKMVDVVLSEESDLWKHAKDAIVRLARIGNVSFGIASANAATVIAGGVTIAVDLAGVVDREKEQTRVAKELRETEAFIVVQETKLANEDFMKRAPEKVIAGEKQKLKDLQEKRDALRKESAAFMA
jgi:valyl-tRNA synthetase